MSHIFPFLQSYVVFVPSPERKVALTLASGRFCCLLNPDWSIQICEAPLVCKALLCFEFNNPSKLKEFRGTQRIVSINYLFGRPSIPSDFLKRIVASNFRDKRNLMSVVFGLLKMSF